jgi:uncharacterized protein YgiM (DUF1202 family)
MKKIENTVITVLTVTLTGAIAWSASQHFDTWTSEEEIATKPIYIQETSQEVLELPTTVGTTEAVNSPVITVKQGYAACNLRTLPSIQSDIITTIPVGTPIKLGEAAGKFQHIQTSHEMGWVHQSCIKF